MEFVDGVLASLGGEPCVPVTPGQMQSGDGTNITQCEQSYVCGCCPVSVEYWSTPEHAWWLMVSQFAANTIPECGIDPGVYEIPLEALGGGSSNGSDDGDSEPEPECRTDYNCGSCERCSDGVCRDCGSGPYGCYC